jgi:DhnA family fructose-bisphosphate aldolase class Ia
MSDFGKQIRLNRILQANKRKTLAVGFDHALIYGPLAGMVNLREQIQAFADNGVDAVVMNLGMLRIAGKGLLIERAPALIIRLDWTSAWTAIISGRALCSEMVASPEEALRAGADAVLTYLFVGTGDNEFEAREIKRNADVARECERIGIPMIVETLARGKDVSNQNSPNWIELHTRIALELGADVLKTEYTGDVESMKGVIRVCPAPILVIGGPWKPENDGLDIVKGAVAAGAAGVFFGRNVYQPLDVAVFREARTILDEPTH